MQLQNPVTRHVRPSQSCTCGAARDNCFRQSVYDAASAVVPARDSAAIPARGGAQAGDQCKTAVRRDERGACLETSNLKVRVRPPTFKRNAGKLRRWSMLWCLVEPGNAQNIVSIVSFFVCRPFPGRGLRPLARHVQKKQIRKRTWRRQAWRWSAGKCRAGNDVEHHGWRAGHALEA